MNTNTTTAIQARLDPSLYDLRASNPASVSEATQPQSSPRPNRQEVPLQVGPSAAPGRRMRPPAVANEPLSKALTKAGLRLREAASGLNPGPLKDLLLQLGGQLDELSASAGRAPMASPAAPPQARSSGLEGSSAAHHSTVSSEAAALEDAAMQLRYACALNPAFSHQLRELASVLQQLAALCKASGDLTSELERKAQEDRLLQRAGVLMADLSTGMSRRAQQRTHEQQCWEQVHAARR